MRLPAGGLADGLEDADGALVGGVVDAKLDGVCAGQGGCFGSQGPAEDLLFLLYTSGSTGKPKGIQHSSGGYLLQEVGQRVADVVVGRFLGFGAAGLFSRAKPGVLGM